MSTIQKCRKRKRSIQDTLVDPTKMQLPRQRLSTLQEELSGIEATENEMEEIMKHVDALQGILGSAKKLKILFSSVQRSDLSNLGLERRPFRFQDAKLDALLAAKGIDPEYIEALSSQIARIYRSTSRRSEAGARMMLDAVLLTIADTSDAKEEIVAIFPEMQIATGDGVLVKNTRNQFETWLIGNIDYGICTYQHEKYRVEAKRDKEMLMDSIPEATSQAIALSEVTGDKTVRYCLSDGNKWMFLVYTCDDQGNRISYEGPLLSIMQSYSVEEAFEKDLQCLVVVLYLWLTVNGDIKNSPLCEI